MIVCGANVAFSGGKAIQRRTGVRSRGGLSHSPLELVIAIVLCFLTIIAIPVRHRHK